MTRSQQRPLASGIDGAAARSLLCLRRCLSVTNICFCFLPLLQLLLRLQPLLLPAARCRPRRHAFSSTVFHWPVATASVLATAFGLLLPLHLAAPPSLSVLRFRRSSFFAARSSPSFALCRPSFSSGRSARRDYDVIDQFWRELFLNAAEAAARVFGDIGRRLYQAAALWVSMAVSLRSLKY